MHFAPSEKAQQLIARLQQFMQQRVMPLEEDLLQQQHHSGDNWQNWSVDPRVEQLKQEAREEGLWNLFLPDLGGLTNCEYAPLAEVMGRSLVASEIFNCNAPDTGNMEVLWKYGSEAQKAEWLQPLLQGHIRSAFCMTEPDVASSDATNMQATITADGDKVVINGKKWWSTGIGHPHCRFVIFMGLTDPQADRYRQHSMVIVPMDAPGVEVKRMLPVFGGYDAPYGHGEVHFTGVRLSKDHVIAGLGRGFEIAQGRLGPGRVHHCMRAIGMAERALELMIRRGAERLAFGKPLMALGGNSDLVANARMDIEMARLLVLKTAWLLDQKGVKAARSEVSQIKVVVPGIACRVIDQAMQLFGGMGMSNDTPLAAMYAYARILRLADGPDEVHRNVVARQELKKYRG